MTVSKLTGLRYLPAMSFLFQILGLSQATELKKLIGKRKPVGAQGEDIKNPSTLFHC